MAGKRMAAALLAIVLLAGSLPAGHVQAAQRELNIQRARELAVKNSSGLQNTIIDKIKKDIELQQAKDGIRDIRRAESTVRFSLLFSIKFPEKHGLPKEIGLIMKIPEIESELKILDKQKTYETLKSEVNAELAFYDTLMGEYSVDFYTKRLMEAKKNYAAIEKQYKSGEGRKVDVDYMENMVATSEKALQSAVLSAASKKRKLGDRINLDIGAGWSFTEYLPVLNITRDELTKIIEHAVKNDFELFKLTQARKIAEREVNELLGIYNFQYSKYISDIKSYIARNQNGKMDYERFIQMYNHTLTRIDSPWYGNYVINLLFFKIRIPKEWFKGTYSGTRYMEDQKYALFIALIEQDKKRQEEKAALKELEGRIYDTYEALKVMERAYDGAGENLERAEKDYGRAYDQNRLGLLDFTSLETVRGSLYEQQKSLYEMRVDYAKELSTFDLYTSGYIRSRLRGSSENDDAYDAGRSFIGEAQWYVRAYITDYGFEFGVNIPEEYNVDEYELYYDGYIVGKRLPVSSALTHLPLTYAENSLMVVRLYGAGKLAYIAYFDGGEYEGILNLTKADADGEQIAGICSASYVNGLMSRFTVTMNDEYDYDAYGLMYGGVEFASVGKGAAIESLNVYFEDMGLLTLNIYKSGKRVKTFTLRNEEVKEDILVASVIDGGE